MVQEYQTVKTNEAVMDVVATLLAAGDKLSWSYDDANGQLQVSTTALDAEEVRDAIASFTSGGNGISVSHDDAGNTLTVSIPAGAIGTNELGFDPATQAELDTHAGDTTNPHNVTDDQTGASTALSNHSGVTDAHHSRYTDTEAANAAPVQSVYGSTGNVTETVSQPSWSASTVYQNSSGAPKYVAAKNNGSVAASVKVGPDSGSMFRVNGVDGSYANGLGTLVPDPWYFEFDTDSIASTMEVVL